MNTARRPYSDPLTYRHPRDLNQAFGPHTSQHIEAQPEPIHPHDRHVCTGVAAMSRPKELPPVTEAHRRAAFAAMAWAGTYEQAMAHDTRRRVVEARASQLRKAEWFATRRHVVRPPQQPSASRLQAGMYRSPGRDGKRAAAGDFDD